MNFSLIQEPAQTMGYMVAGYSVILGIILLYILSLSVRWRRWIQKEKDLKNYSKERQEGG